MRQAFLKMEWNILNNEMFTNKPKREPFSEKVIKRRELLLLAQHLLSDIEYGKSSKFRRFKSELYQRTMKIYFSWYKKHDINGHIIWEK